MRNMPHLAERSSPQMGGGNSCSVVADGLRTAAAEKNIVEGVH
jgi:hypothetical protein